MEWTREQLAAITADNHTILVSAAAGSGKTAVLVERILRLVRGGARLNRMLIMTFTRAAAAEMRERLHVRLQEAVRDDPERIGQALEDLETTLISTIHAFCQHVLRSEFQAAVIDPMARVCTEQEAAGLYDEAWRESMNARLSDAADADMQDLADRFTVEELRAACRTMQDFVLSMPHPWDFAEKSAAVADAEPLETHPWVAALTERARLECGILTPLLRAEEELTLDPAAHEKYLDTLRSDAERVAAVTEAARSGSGAQLIAALNGFALDRLPPVKGMSEEEKAWKDAFSEARKAVKKAVDRAREPLAFDPDVQRQDLKTVARNLHALVRLAADTAARFNEKKRERRLLDFSDLEQLTAAVLTDPAHPEVRGELMGEYDHIFVDECQDNSRIQDEIIQAVHGEHACLFMVGDVKQSIYRFRMADPTLFLHRLRTFSREADAPCRAIFLQRNFRSCGSVIEAANRVFERAMRADVTELDYLPEDRLVHGLTDTDAAPVEIGLAPGELKKKESSAAETAFVIRRMLDLHGRPRADGKGVYRWRDMAVLMARVAGGTAAAVGEALENSGIPVFFDGKETYYDLPEVRGFRSMLQAVDDPTDDIPLVAVLRQHPFSFPDETLALIRECSPGSESFYEAFQKAAEAEGGLGETCRAAQARLAEWRFRSASMSLADFLRWLLEDSGWLLRQSVLPRGELREANLRLLVDKAEQYADNGGLTLTGFLGMIEGEISTGDAAGAKPLGEQDDLVRITTMHKSKGLEWPVVFLMGLGDGMAHRDTVRLGCHREAGFVLPYTNRALSIRRDTVGADAVAFRRALDEKAERCRLLYVAMTRARERLILTGAADEKNRRLWRMPDGPARVWAADSMLDWVMQAVCDLSPGADPGQPFSAGPFVCSPLPADTPPERAAQGGRDAAEAWLRRTLETARDNGALAWWDEKPPARALPLKTSVTGLVRQQADALAVSGEDETPEDKRLPFLLSELPSVPRFAAGTAPSGAARGTLMHRFLSLVDLDRVRSAGDGLAAVLRDSLAEMTAGELFTPEEASNVSLRQISAFFRDPLGQRVLRAEQVRREWSFNRRLPDGRLLQGVMDCVFLEEGQWILCDYKTDHIDSWDDFTARHAQQMSLYAEALAAVTGIPVREKWLYSLSRGRAVPCP